ncbi:putative heparinase superfamily protein [Sphingomonas sp. BE138]|uniref:heparinase II/III family protein n=1 Tax=Sphingomonas sp. BE138 TaxID=2817845 RepID=UPI002863FDB8|nr:heparinase II/III family protein [Sphingomonas sp. BE138]MDR6788763.1 putative heparinase superfamily protein [Sphingomonas sp. BE138]
MTDDRTGIDSDKHIIAAGTGESLGDRVATWFERLTWRTPLHDRRLDGQHPVKLVGAPVDPLPAETDLGEALLDGWMYAGGEHHAIETLDMAAPAAGPAFVDYLHGFGWLRDLSAIDDRARTLPLAEALAGRWLAAHGDRVSDPAWRPAVTARRLAMWSFHAPLLLSSSDLVFRSRILNGIARAARHLDRTADKAPPGHERVAAWTGVLIAGLLLPGGEPRVAIGEAGLTRALATGMTADGGVVSRSPAALLDLLATLALLRAACEARGLPLPDCAIEALGRATPALLGTTLGDGALSSWQGGLPVDAETVNDVLLASGAHGRPLRQSRDWGYQRLANGQAVLIVDAAPPPVARVAEGGCASTLAFEFSDGAERLIVNCGGAGVTGARMSPAMATGLRSTAAHSTLTIGDTNSTAILADGSLGKGVREVELTRQESELGSRIEARHDGYARRHGFHHQRTLLLLSDGRELRGEDALLAVPGARPRRPDAMTPFLIRFHLAAGVEAVATADNQAAMLRTAAGNFWHFRSRGERLTIEDSVWVDAFGRLFTTQQIVIHGLAPPGGVNVNWVMKRAR